eukprot:CAMPEP_0202890180 /NCGR_PEP_ID=MMETSP1392-20130828/679_1 /ASSEMBLY_ACC=CAM_ASM_000868 /TAXON_ID=225041 /ORGANISM="Chlamydomonas chlamydogama, Strain SAG 11-48b" /LENGTH=182 /DNA_ID=CAMNT_0049573709 /DNA_START=208 /DNA_END=756 /DNA_ORIENTATION=+
MPGYQSQTYEPQVDPVGSAFNGFSEIASTSAKAVVCALTDMLTAVSPPQAPRLAVENTVKGGLVLVGLVLLQNMLSVVLLLGTLVLAVYAATQVFGIQLPFVARPEASGADKAGQGTHGQGAGPGGAAWQQQQQQAQQQAAQQKDWRQGRYRTPGAGQHHTTGARSYNSSPRSNDVIDVYYE